MSNSKLDWDGKKQKVMISKQDPPSSLQQVCGLKQALSVLQRPYVWGHHASFIDAFCSSKWLQWCEGYFHGVFIYVWLRTILAVLWHGMCACGWPCTVQEEGGHMVPKGHSLILPAYRRKRSGMGATVSPAPESISEEMTLNPMCWNNNLCSVHH